MVKTRTVLNRLSRYFPKALAYKNHDPRIGLQLGKLPEYLTHIVLCLDFDETISEEVIKMHPDLVLTHHPFIFGPKGKVLAADPLKAELAAQMQAAGIPIYSMHTNFDEGKGGMNDALAELLGLVNVHPLVTDAMARGGEIPEPQDIYSFATNAIKKLDVPYGQLIAAGKKTIKTVAIIGGGGSRTWRKAKDEGYDIYISGDAPHYVRRDIVRYGYNYLDVPHEIERAFLNQMKHHLLTIDPQLNITIIDQEKCPEIIVPSNKK